MSKLVDLFVEWAKRKQRWPLLLILLIPAWFAFFQKLYGLTFQQTLANRWFLWLSGLTVAIAAIGSAVVTNYERIIYSRTLARWWPGRRAVVTAPIAWQRLTYEDGTGEVVSKTIVREVADMLEDFAIRPVIATKGVDVEWLKNPRNQFGIYGVVSPTGTLLESWINSPGSDQTLQIGERFLQRLGSTFTPQPGTSGSVPWTRVFDPSSVVSMFKSELSIGASITGGERAALMRVFLRHALMVMLYRDQNDKGKSVAGRIINLGELLPPIESPGLAKIYRSVAFYLLHDVDPEQVFRALILAGKFAPDEPVVVAAQVLLHLKEKRIAAVAPLLAALAAKTNDPALLSWLEADHLMALKQPEAAITAYERTVARA